MPTKTLRSLALTSATGLALSGCSFLLVKRPPATVQRPRQVECTTSYAPPVMDVLLGVTMGTTAALGVLGTQKSTPDAKVPLFFLGFSPFIASSAFGFKGVSDCRETLQLAEASSYRRRTVSVDAPANKGVAGGPGPRSRSEPGR
jgi:hypothetical protein